MPTKPDFTFDLTSDALKPVLAGVGVTDLAVEIVRDAVADVQKRVAAVQKFDARAYPAKVTTQVSSLVDENVAAANATYSELVRRGESLVGRIRRQESTRATASSAKTTVAKAKATATQAKKAAEATTTAADRTAATKVAPKPKPTAKKATRSASAKKASATTARKTAAKRTATAQGSAKATATAATTTAANATQAVVDAAEKIGD